MCFAKQANKKVVLYYTNVDHVRALSLQCWDLDQTALGCKSKSKEEAIEAQRELRLDIK